MHFNIQKTDRKDHMDMHTSTVLFCFTCGNNATTNSVLKLITALVKMFLNIEYWVKFDTPYESTCGLHKMQAGLIGLNQSRNLKPIAFPCCRLRGHVVKKIDKTQHLYFLHLLYSGLT